MTPDHEFRDEQFMTAAEKQKVLRAWTRFLKNGCAKTQFTEALYHHLSLHCSFIAHFDRNGFYNFYFERITPQLFRFFDQFDAEKPGISAEYGSKGWLSPHSTGADLNHAMREAARPYLAGLRQQFGETRRQRDISTATAILAGYGLTTITAAPNTVAAEDQRNLSEPAAPRTPVQPQLFTD